MVLSGLVCDRLCAVHVGELDTRPDRQTIALVWRRNLRSIRWSRAHLLVGDLYIGDVDPNTPATQFAAYFDVVVVGGVVAFSDRYDQ